MNLKQVQGLGPSKITKLEAAGITTVQKLAALDLRKNVDVPGVSRDAMRQHKADARHLLTAEGKNVPKAPYSSKAKASGKRAKPKRTAATHAKAPAKEAPEPRAPRTRLVLPDDPQPKRQGFFRRLLRRA